MSNPFRRLVHNAGPRLRLLRTALTRRYIYDDLTLMVKAHGFELREIRANLHPLRFAALLPVATRGLARPDFTSALGALSSFDSANAQAWNSEPSVSEFLGELVVRLQARTVVELGCFIGWTSAHLACALKAAGAGGQLWCLDSDARYLEAARTNLARRQLAAPVTFVRGLSLEPAALAALPTSCDLVFIDTSHDYHLTKEEIARYGQRLAPGGMLVLHDSISQYGVRQAVLEAADQFEILTFATEFGNGLTVLLPRTPA